ncbi:MAG: tetratricopeptide repeat protein [Pseudomonadota bacterium]|nr:tetratricopeptide repeat protein [Pseudomonadota bacterium]
MSYINEALTKAQKEKDKSSGNIQPVITAAPAPVGKRGRYGPAVTATAVAVVALAVVAIFYLWHRDLPGGKAGAPTGPRPPVAVVAPRAMDGAATSPTGLPPAGAAPGTATSGGQPAALPPAPAVTTPRKEAAKGVYQGPPAPGAVVAGAAGKLASAPGTAMKPPPAASSAQPAPDPASPLGMAPRAAKSSPAAAGTAGLSAKREDNSKKQATSVADAGRPSTPAGKAGPAAGATKTPPVQPSASRQSPLGHARQERAVLLAGGAAQTRAGKDEELRRLYQDALASQRGRDPDRAARLYSRLLEKDPRHVEALNNLGVIYMRQQQSGHALRLFERAIAVKPDYVDPYYNLACLYAQYRDVANAMKYLKKAAAINPEVRVWAGADEDLKKVGATPEFRAFLGEGKDK